MDRRRRPLTVRLFVLPQDRKYLSLSQARDKALSIDWLAQPRPGKLDGDKLECKKTCQVSSHEQCEK